MTTRSPQYNLFIVFLTALIVALLSACTSQSNSNATQAGTPPEMITLNTTRFTADPQNTWSQSAKGNIPQDVILKSFNFGRRQEELCQKKNHKDFMTVQKAFDPRFIQRGSVMENSVTQSAKMSNLQYEFSIDASRTTTLNNLNAGTFMTSLTYRNFKMPGYTGPILKNGLSFPIVLPPTESVRSLEADAENKDWVNIQDNPTTTKEQQEAMAHQYFDAGFISWTKKNSTDKIDSGTPKNCESKFTENKDWTSSYKEISYGFYKLDSGKNIPALLMKTEYIMTEYCNGQPTGRMDISKSIRIVSTQPITTSLSDYCDGMSVFSSYSSIKGTDISQSRTEVRDVTLE